MKVNNHLLILSPICITSLFVSTGCIIPQLTEFQPAPASQSFIRDKNNRPTTISAPIPIQLQDATSQRPIENAMLLVLLHRNQYVGLCCAAHNLGDRKPILHLEPFARLPDLRYHDFNLIVILPPLYVGDTMPSHTYTSLIAYAPGYTPVPVQGTNRPPPALPTTIPLKRCDPSQSRAALATALSREMTADEEFYYGPDLQARLRQLLDQYK